MNVGSLLPLRGRLVKPGSPGADFAQDPLTWSASRSSRVTDSVTTLISLRQEVKGGSYLYGRRTRTKYPVLSRRVPDR